VHFLTNKTAAHIKTASGSCFLLASAMRLYLQVRGAAHRKLQIDKYAGKIHVLGMAVITFSLIHKVTMKI
jgi:hypothetical protein